MTEQPSRVGEIEGRAVGEKVSPNSVGPGVLGDALGEAVLGENVGKGRVGSREGVVDGTSVGAEVVG